MLIEIYWQYSHFCMCLDRGGTAVLPVDTTGTYMYLPVPVRVGMCKDLHVHMARVDLHIINMLQCRRGVSSFRSRALSVASLDLAAKRPAGRTEGYYSRST